MGRRLWRKKSIYVVTKRADTALMAHNQFINSCTKHLVYCLQSCFLVLRLNANGKVHSGWIIAELRLGFESEMFIPDKGALLHSPSEGAPTFAEKMKVQHACWAFPRAEKCDNLFNFQVNIGSSWINVALDAVFYLVLGFSKWCETLLGSILLPPSLCLQNMWFKKKTCIYRGLLDNRSDFGWFVPFKS